MQRRLHCGPTDAGERSDLVEREVTDASSLDLTSDDAEHCALALGVVVPEGVRERARSAEHAAPLSRCLAIRRPRTLP